MSRQRPAPLLPALALPAVFLLLAGRAAAMPAEGTFQLDAGESMPLAVRLDQLVLSEELPAFVAGGRFFLPLGELCRLLDLAIDVDAGRGLAAGFLIEEKRRFQLDLHFRRVEIGGGRLTFDAAAVRQEADDIYVDSELLAKWLPLDLAVDPHQLSLRVTPREKLPLQLRLEREKKLARSGGAGPAVELPRQELPYRLFDGPLVDASLRYSRRGDFARGGALAPETSDGLEYSLLATGDLLFLEANLFLYGDQGGILDSRLSLGRKDPDGRLLGVLEAREVMLGEVFHPGLELIALPRSGPGFLLSNFPLGQPSQFGRESFRGELPPGWEAELYRGEELLAYVRSRPDGLYEFLDVPLLFGLNLFRIELYGPQGQRRTERRLLNIGDSLTPPGELYYRLAGNDPGARLVGQAPGELGPRLSLELGTGISKQVSATFSVASVEHRRRRARYAQAGLRAFHGPLLASLDLALDESGGRAFKGELQSRWRGLGLRLEHTELDDFDSETLATAGGKLRRRTWLRLDTVLRGSRLPAIPLYFDLRQEQLADGRRITEIAGRFSAYARGLTLSNQLQLSQISGDDAPPRLATGQLLLSKHLPALAFRGSADYQLKPRFELVALAATAELRRPNGLLLSGGASRLFLARETIYQIGVSKLEGRIGATVTVDYAASRGLGIGVLLAASLGRDSRDGSWHQQARPLAFGGGLSGRAFLDDNGNGRFDPGEQPIGGAGLLLGGANQGQRSSPEGTLFLANLAPYQPVSVSLAANTLEDPYWQPARSGVTLTPRPGKVAIVDFPVEVTGELSGTVYLLLPGGRRPAAGIEVELIDAAGKVIARARSAADGFYYLDRLRPGRFTLRIAAADASRRRLAPPPDRPIRLAASGSLLENLDFELGQLDSAAG
jgi:hypothetical protein